MNVIMQALLADKEPTNEDMTAAAEMAEAQLKILNVRQVRLEMMQGVLDQCQDLEDFPDWSPWTATSSWPTPSANEDPKSNAGREPR